MSESLRRASVGVLAVLAMILAALLVPSALASPAHADDCGDPLDGSSGVCVQCLPGDPQPTQVFINSVPGTFDGTDPWFTTAPAVTVIAYGGDEAQPFCGTGVNHPIAASCVLDPDPAPASYGDLSASCDLPATIPDGIHTVYAGATAATGEDFQHRQFNVDTRAPVVTCTTPAPTFLLGGAGGNVSASVADDTSATTDTSGAVSSSASSAADVSTPGLKSVDVSGADHAGNVGVAHCPYVVGYSVRGFLSPLPRASYKRGSTIPVKFQLSDASGRISDAAAAAIANACGATIAYTGGNPSPNCFGYSTITHAFQFDLKIGKSPTGPQTIAATVKVGGNTVNTLSVIVVIS